jgi:hypothetical protein
MIQNIPNKYTGKRLTAEINKTSKDKYDFFYLPIDFKNNCNMGYAFINFIHRAYILDFYYTYDSKRWPNYNSEKVCKISYGRYQGKSNLINHHRNTRIGRSHNNKVRPMIKDTPHINQTDVKEVLDRYYRQRFKEKADFDDKPKDEIKDVDISNPETPIIEVPKPEEFKIEDSDHERADRKKKHALKAYQIFEKRKSQAASENKTVLDEKKQSKRHASDDDKGVSSEDDKGQKKENKISTKPKINLKHISMTSRCNFNGNGASI